MKTPCSSREAALRIFLLPSLSHPQTQIFWLGLRVFGALPCESSTDLSRICCMSCLQHTASICTASAFLPRDERAFSGPRCPFAAGLGIAEAASCTARCDLGAVCWEPGVRLLKGFFCFIFSPLSLAVQQHIPLCAGKELRMSWLIQRHPGCQEGFVALLADAAKGCSGVATWEGKLCSWIDLLHAS